MQHFQPILIVIGVLAIAAVLIHGYILSRKEQTALADNCAQEDDKLAENNSLESQQANIEDIPIISANFDNQETDSEFFVALDTDKIEEISLDTEISSQPFTDNIVYLDSGEQILESPIFTDNEEVDGKVANAAVSEKQLDTEENAVIESVDSQIQAEQQKVVQETEDIFIFNVVAKENGEVRGHELLQFFLTAGFRFGEMSIFHRHLHSDGTGPILFSIANMMAPGVFDPERMKQFRSEGVSFFLTAPNHDIDIKKAFDLMLVAVEQMAEEFDCIVLNAQREPLTELQFIDYRERLLKYI